MLAPAGSWRPLFLHRRDVHGGDDGGEAVADTGHVLLLAFGLLSSGLLNIRMTSLPSWAWLALSALPAHQHLKVSPMACSCGGSGCAARLLSSLHALDALALWLTSSLLAVSDRAWCLRVLYSGQSQVPLSCMSSATAGGAGAGSVRLLPSELFDHRPGDRQARGAPRRSRRSEEQRGSSGGGFLEHEAARAGSQCVVQTSASSGFVSRTRHPRNVLFGWFRERRRCLRRPRAVIEEFARRRRQLRRRRPPSPS